MPDKWTVQECQTRTIGETPCWEVALTRTDGAIHRHVMPTTILEQYAAAYGIDPTDVDTLLEIVLHEPHMPMVDDPQHGPRYADRGPDLWSADNTDDARAAHLARVKATPVRIDVRGAKALAGVRAGHRPDADRIREIREQVDTHRWMKKYGDLPVTPKNPKNPLEDRRA